MVHRPGEVLVEDERHADNLAEPAIGEADTVCLDELRRRGLVGVNHLVGPFHSVGTASGRSARAALAQSMSFCTMGAPLTPTAPTTSRRYTRKRGDAGQKRRVALDKVEKVLSGDAE